MLEFNEIFHIVNLNIVDTHVLLGSYSAISDNENKLSMPSILKPHRDLKNHAEHFNDVSI